jgi:hypothetical protein
LTEEEQAEERSVPTPELSSSPFVLQANSAT